MKEKIWQSRRKGIMNLFLIVVGQYHYRSTKNVLFALRGRNWPPKIGQGECIIIMLRKATERISLHKILTKATSWLVKAPLYCNRAATETNRYLLLLKSFFFSSHVCVFVCPCERGKSRETSSFRDNQEDTSFLATGVKKMVCSGNN